VDIWRTHAIRHEALRRPLATARLVAVDIETTGPRMDVDRLISIGAVAVTACSIRHDDSFERVLRQARSSTVQNILIHRIGGQEQLAGAEPGRAFGDFLKFLDASVAVAFRASFDATILRRKIRAALGVKLRTSFVDLAICLPALFPGTQNDTLDDWISFFGVPLAERHCAVADAYAHAALLLILLQRARSAGLHCVGDLRRLEKAQRWLGKVR